jgi:ubiquinone/menaquinone biosynthesis C-methylase UbiE
MTDVTERWRTERVMAAMYDAGVKHDGVAMVGAWAMWGTDMRRMFADVARLADTPAGSSVLDIPCGGGFALRALRPGQSVRYVAADISPHMLQRARQEAQRKQTQDTIEFVEADVTALQFDDASFDLCVTYNGLHCLPDPRAALAELTRVLRPGGTLRGTSCVTGRGLRKDALIAALRRAGVFGNAPRAGEIETWLRDLGLDVVALEHSGAVEFFEAQLPLGDTKEINGDR